MNFGLGEFFIQTLTQLQEAFFVESVAAGRQILGALSGMAFNELISNRSMPIVTTTLTFDRLHRDPRPIAGDLKHAYVGEGLLRMLYIWQQLLKHGTFLQSRPTINPSWPLPHLLANLQSMIKGM